jgi:uncharacterized protein (TIGR02147 family)
MNKTVFDYIDYTEFLKDSVKSTRERKPIFSHRYIAQSLGLRSSGYFLYILQGKRKLSEELALKTAALFKLNKRETEYFILLVGYARAKSHLEKQFLFERIALARRKAPRIIEPASYNYYEKWYHLAIREYVAIHAFSDDFDGLARTLTPAITSAQAKEAVETLETIGLIAKNADGLYERADAVTTTGDTWQSETIHNLQQQLLDISKEALERLPKEQRDFSNCTVSMSLETFELVRTKIAALRAQILDLARTDTNPQAIYQINVQAFPLHIKEKGGKP